jgi:hypothetical protein
VILNKSTKSLIAETCRFFDEMVAGNRSGGSLYGKYTVTADIQNQPLASFPQGGKMVTSTDG